MKNPNLIFDFDSTLLKLETIEILAEIALEKNKNKHIILKDIKRMTELAMSGKMSFPEALKKRISLLDIRKSHVNKTIKFLKNKLSDSFYENLENFKKNMDNCFVISGGFKEIIVPILEPYGFNKKKIYANTFIYTDKGTMTIDESNVLAQNRGKTLIANDIPGHNIIIGDGYTDYELKKFGKAEIFILFVENIYRYELSQKSDYIAKNFNEVFNYLNNA